MKRKNVLFKLSLRCLATICCFSLLVGSTAYLNRGKNNTISVYATEEGVEGFIDRLYELILGREADEEGLGTWTRLLLSGERTGVGVAEGFILSDEFLKKSMSDEEFVEIMYCTFLDREADEGGLATWLGMLEQGYSRKFIFSGFANSDEFQTVCDGYGIERGFIELTEEEKRPVVPEGELNVSQFVERLYSEILGRTADADGLNTWVTLLENGAYSGAEVAEGFILSDEFINTDMTDAEYVHIMYKTFFDREADEGGLTTWMNALEDGYSKQFVFAGFANSTEFGTLCEAYGIEQGSVANGLEPIPNPDDNLGGGLDEALGTIETVTENFGEKLKENNIKFWIYFASVAPVSQFKTAEGGYGVAYHGEEITILLYDKDLSLQDTVVIETEEGQIGAVTCDENRCFYVVYGITNETDDISKEVMRVVKYSEKGKKLASVSYTGEETGAYSSDFGTKRPFDAANCSMVVKNGLLVCTYGRQMYNGHQSSNSLYVETETMEKADISSIYTSHSFDQQVIPTWDGGFLFADHGDAYGRSFTVSKLLNGGDNIEYEMESFHFREGANRDHGYNETYAQLGGLAELPGSYVLVAASERTLSLDTAPTNRERCGYSEPRDLFIQYLKKDYGEYSGADCYAVEGENRPATGTRPENALTDLWLPRDVEDYGVIWLTEYTGEEMVYNPKVATTETGEAVILWNKTLFSEQEIVDTYYMILDSEGNVLQEATSLGKVPLSKDEPVVYVDGSIYWSVAEGEELTTYRFVVSEDILSGLEDDVTWEVFDADYYLEKYPNLGETVGTDAVELYLYWINAGMHLGQSATPVLVTWEYMQLNPELAKELDYDHIEAMRHFFEQGIYEGLRGSREFDYEVYAQYNPDVSDLCGDDIVAYYEHYVKYGREEGRTASADTSTGETEELGEMLVVPEGTKKFMTPDGRVVAMFFEDGQMIEQKFYDCTGALERNLLNYYFDEEGTSYYLLDKKNYSILVDYRIHSSGGATKEENASEGGFAYVDILSANEDGTLTVCLKEVKAGTSTTYYYTEVGILNFYFIREYENGNVIIASEYTSDNVMKCWHSYDYFESGNLKRITTYQSEGTGKPSEMLEYDEDGNLIKVSKYTEEGKLDSYLINEYENGKWILQTKYSSENVIENWYSVEYYESGKKKKEAEYLGEGTDKPSYIYEYYESGNYRKIETYRYEGAVIKYVILSTYDESGKCRKKENYWYENGIIDYFTLYMYDENGNRVYEENRFYNKNGEMTSYIISEYKNDKVVVATYYTPEGVIESWSTHEYYDNGNQKKTISYHGEGTSKPSFIFSYNEDGSFYERRFYSYDSNGNLLEEYYYDAAGNLITVFPNT